MLKLLCFYAIIYPLIITERESNYGHGIDTAVSDAYRPKIEINGGQISIVMKGEDTDVIDSNADLIITGGTIERSNSGIDYDGTLVFTGGTVIIDGEEVQNIPNQSIHRVDS